jgi:hypothetical protein
MRVAKDGIQIPQCVVCLKTLSSDAKWPPRLECHLSQNHGKLIKNRRSSFLQSATPWSTWNWTNNTGTFHGESAGAVKASHETAVLIAKGEKKSSHDWTNSRENLHSELAQGQQRGQLVVTADDQNLVHETYPRGCDLSSYRLH